MIRKKKWHRPTLMVLLRGKREEGVLTFCKNLSVNGPPDLVQCADMSTGEIIPCAGSGGGDS